MPCYKDLDPREVSQELLKAGTAAAEEAAGELGLMPVPRVQWYKDADELSYDWADPCPELGHCRALENVIWVNVAQSLSSTVHTIRHECQHLLEYSTGVLPRLKGQITATEYREAEQRAEAFARRETLAVASERLELYDAAQQLLRNLSF